jgi:hypothetical protein
MHQSIFRILQLFMSHDNSSCLNVTGFFFSPVGDRTTVEETDASLQIKSNVIRRSRMIECKHID